MHKWRNSNLKPFCSCQGERHSECHSECHDYYHSCSDWWRNREQQTSLHFGNIAPLINCGERGLWFVMCHTHNNTSLRQSVMKFAWIFIHPSTLSCTILSTPLPGHFIHPCLLSRSADEPMTTFVLCNECGKRWKFCWRIKTTLNVLFDLSRTNRTVPVIWCPIRRGPELNEEENNHIVYLMKGLHQWVETNWKPQFFQRQWPCGVKSSPNPCKKPCKVKSDQ